MARLQGDLSRVQGQFQASKELSQVQDIIAGRLLAAQQELTEEMKRLQQQRDAAYQRPADAPVGGIPVDSEYIIFVIDTSGSMQRFAWPLLRRKMDEVLDAYPKVKGLQIMNDEGVYMFSSYAGKWIPDTPGPAPGDPRAAAQLERVQQLVPGRGHRGRDQDASGRRDQQDQHLRVRRRVHRRLDRRGARERGPPEPPRTRSGERKVRIHAIGFPTLFSQREYPGDHRRSASPC